MDGGEGTRELAVDNELDEKQLPVVKPTKSIYLHCSIEPILKIHSTEQYPYDVRPMGLWYSNGQDWRNLMNPKIKSRYVDDYLKYNESHPVPKDKRKWKKYFNNIKLCQNMYRVHVNHVPLKKKARDKTSDEDKKSVLLIQTLDEYRKFMRIYSQGLVAIRFYGQIMNAYIPVKWSIVKKDYGGFEIKNIRKIINQLLETNNAYDDHIAYTISTFDIDSGCVWNSKAVKVNRVRLDEHAAMPKRNLSAEKTMKKNRLKMLYRLLRRKSSSALSSKTRKRTHSSPATSTLVSKSLPDSSQK